MAKSTVAVRFTGEGAGLQGVLGDLDSKMGGFGQKLVSSVGPAGLAFAGVASAAAGIGVGLFKLGGDFQEQFNKITVGTGATGKALQGLDNDFKNVLKSGPDSMDQVGTAITTLNQKLGLTGKPLEDLSTKFLDLSRITKTDLGANIAGATGLFNQFGVSAQEQGSKLDMLFRASQASGVSIADLESQISGSATVFKALGFSVEQATTVVAGLGKEGLSTADVMPALSRVLAEGAKTGKSAQTVYQDLIHSIKSAPSDTAAASIAFQELGAKAGPKFAELIRSGKYSFDQLGESIGDGSNTIEGSAKKVETFGEKWDTIKNRILVGLEPVATAVFNGVGSAMDKLGPIIDNDIVPAFNRIGAWWQQNGPGIEAFVSQVFGTIQSVIQAAVSIISALWDTFGSTILANVKGTFEGIRDQIQGVMDIIRGIIQTVTALIHGDWGQAWDGIKEIFTGVWLYIKGVVEQAMAAVHAVISAGWIVIKGVFTGALSGIQTAVSGGFNTVVTFVKGVPGKIVGALGDVAHMLYDAGKKIIGGLLSGIKDAALAIPHAIGSVASAIADHFPHSPVKTGPLTALNNGYMGGRIITDILDGMKAQEGPLLDFVSQMAASISSQVQGVASVGAGLNLSVIGGPATDPAGIAANLAAAGRTTAQMAAAHAAQGSAELHFHLENAVISDEQSFVNFANKLRKVLTDHALRNGPATAAFGI